MERSGAEGGPAEGISFGERLRRLRAGAGLTQEELAASAGLTAKAISSLERGERRRPYPHTVRSLADALGLSDGDRELLTRAVPQRAASPPETPGRTPPALPVPLTPLLGREGELETIVGALAEPAVRLLTLTGPGGIGKTRLAIEAARRAAVHFPDGVAFVALAPLREAALVTATAARVLGLGESAGVRPLEALREHLRERRSLLVLDNFEHVAEAASEVVDLLGSCPDLCVVVTSRAPLRVRGEHEYAVSPLAVPDPAHLPGAGDVGSSPAGALFVERAGEASPGFSLSDQNAAAVAAICWRLDGLPLALELAAAQTRFLGTTALLDRLDQALQVGGARDLPERQRTMRATLDWSHDLLGRTSRGLFRRLAVFSGGFTLEAAEEVCAFGAVEEGEVMMLLGNLVEQSLVVAEAQPGGGTRYRMLEPVRQYALERLQSGGEEDEARRRHVRRYLALAERAEPRIKGREQAEWLDRLERENDNLRAAIGWSLDSGDASLAVRIGYALCMYWVMRARHGEGQILMERAAARRDLPASMRARALYALGASVYGSGQEERLLDIAGRGLEISRQAGDSYLAAFHLGLTGMASLQVGDERRASRALEESLRIFRERGDDWATAQILNHLAVAPMRRGDYTSAVSYAREALALADRIGDRLAANMALYLLAQAAASSGELERARDHYRRGLALAFEISDRASAAYCLQGLAAVAEAGGEVARAARLLGASEQLLEAAEAPQYAQMDRGLLSRVRETVRRRLGPEVGERALMEGRALDFAHAVEYAMAEGGDEEDSAGAPGPR